jgi:hypothetical protein
MNEFNQEPQTGITKSHPEAHVLIALKNKLGVVGEPNHEEHDWSSTTCMSV